MAKKNLKFALILLIVAITWAAWILLGPATTFPQKSSIIYIKSNDQQPYQNLMAQMDTSSLIKYPRIFKFLANQLHLSHTLKQGRFEYKKGQSLLSILRMFKNNQQAPIKLIITKFRTKEQLSGFLAKKMEFSDSAFFSFLNDDAQLSSYNLNSRTVMAVIMPNTYEIYWNSTPKETFEKILQYYHRFWSEDKINKAQKQGLTPIEATIIASIVEEETAYEPEKSLIASVYINRLKSGMRLQADPTIKFALNDFTIKRIYEKHLIISSPYNTYRNEGLPPGPICIPSVSSLKAVLEAPKTDYFYFVAKSDFSGKHEFSHTYEEHLTKAKAFQEAQDVQELLKKNKKKEETQL